MPSPTEMYRPELGAGGGKTTQGAGGPSYYDISLLKPPVWKWEIATYFFCGGLVAGSYLLARLAERCGGREYREITRIGTYTACAALLPCPALLIHDLGDPARFHHMLRVWKPKSPMNLGTWILTAFSGVALAAGGRELLRARGWGKLNVVMGAVGIVADAAGLPLAIGLASYTGVLLSNSATPVWARNAWLSPLFVIGAMSSGASAIGLVLEAKKSAWAPETGVERTLKKFSTVAHVADVAAFAGYLASMTPETRKPFTTGSMKSHTVAAFAGVAAAEVLKHAPVPRPLRKAARMAGKLISLASAFSMRWAVVYAAHESGNDPEAARRTSRAEDGRYDWLLEKGQVRERTEGVEDEKAISTLDPTLGYNPKHL